MNVKAKITIPTLSITEFFHSFIIALSISTATTTLIPENAFCTTSYLEKLCKDVAIIIIIYSKIYKNGYYCKWNEKEEIILCKKTLVDVNVINNIINDSINEGIFDQNLFRRYSILTSNGVQKRYFEACTRRKEVQAIKEYLVADLKSYSNIVYVSINSINANNNANLDDNNVEFSTQSKVKESKVKKKESKDKSIERISNKEINEEEILNGDEMFGTDNKNRLHSDIIKRDGDRFKA